MSRGHSAACPVRHMTARLMPLLQVVFCCIPMQHGPCAGVTKRLLPYLESRATVIPQLPHTSCAHEATHLRLPTPPWPTTRYTTHHDNLPDCPLISCNDLPPSRPACYPVPIHKAAPGIR